MSLSPPAMKWNNLADSSSCNEIFGNIFGSYKLYVGLKYFDNRELSAQLTRLIRRELINTELINVELIKRVLISEDIFFVTHESGSEKKNFVRNKVSKTGGKEIFIFQSRKLLIAIMGNPIKTFPS